MKDIDKSINHLPAEEKFSMTGNHANSIDNPMITLLNKNRNLVHCYRWAELPSSRV